LVDGTDVYAAGEFVTAGGVTANGIAMWNGSDWSALGEGMNSDVLALAADTSSGDLYAGGGFTTAGGISADHVARWDGAAWSALGSGTNLPVHALAMAGSEGLYAGGEFTTAGTKSSLHIGRWFNTPPDALDDGYTTVEETPLVVAVPGVLTNDGDAQGDLLTAAEGILPLSGSLTLEPDGSFVYTPTLNYYGAITFTYAITDGYGGLDTATVAITVTNVNDAPDAADDAYTTALDTPLVVAAPGVLENDGDVDGDALTSLLDSPPIGGALSLSPNGDFIYIPTLGSTGTITFTYVADDGLVGSSAATVTIAVGTEAQWKVYLPLVLRNYPQ
jgi:hypothetical protein